MNILWTLSFMQWSEYVIRKRQILVNESHDFSQSNTDFTKKIELPKNQMTLTNKTQVLLNNADFTWYGQWNSGFTKQRGFHMIQSQNAGFT